MADIFEHEPSGNATDKNSPAIAHKNATDENRPPVAENRPAADENRPPVAYRFDDIDFESELIDIIKLFFHTIKPSEAHLTDEAGCAAESGYMTVGAGAFLFGKLSCGSEGCIYSISLEYYAHKSLNPNMSQQCTPSECGPLPEYKILLEAGVPSRHDLDARKNFKREVRRGIYTLLSKYTGNKPPWGMLTGIRPAKIAREMLDSGLGKDAIMAGLQQYYMISGPKADLLYNVASAEKYILDSSASNEVSLYIGIPFCPTRCLYCSFTSNSISACSGIVQPYLSALKREIEYLSGEIRDLGLKLQNIYVGGGTPTSIDAGSLRDLFGCIEAAFDLGTIREYTVEAGRPDSLDSEKLIAIRKSAANRISINPQSMNGATLKIIGREHSPEDIINAFHMARDSGFNNINMDVIAGLPGENADMFRHTMEQIGELCPESLTVHTLAIKRASRLKQEGIRLRGMGGLKHQDTDRFKMQGSNDGMLLGKLEGEIFKMIDMAGYYAQTMGMRPYYLYRQKDMLGNLENVGYCKPGCESIYNVQIMEEKQTIFAAGAGAVTKVVFPAENRIERAFNVKNVEEYIKRIDEMISRKRLLLRSARL